MPRIAFTPNLQRHLDCPPLEVPGADVRAALEAVFERNPRLRGYVLDEQGRLRRHVAVFVDTRMIRDRDSLADPVGSGSEIYVVQALSGG
jgi:hypothetical protein